MWGKISILVKTHFKNRIYEEIKLIDKKNVYHSDKCGLLWQNR